MSASSLASKVLQTSSNLQSNMRQMKTSVEAIQNSWNGENYDGFRQSYNELEKKLITSNSAWEGIANQLNSLSLGILYKMKSKYPVYQLSFGPCWILFLYKIHNYKNTIY